MTTTSRKVRNYFKKNKEANLKIISARYVHTFSIMLTFDNGKSRLVDFLPLFQKFVKGVNLKYFAPELFKNSFVKTAISIGEEMRM